MKKFLKGLLTLTLTLLCFTLASCAGANKLATTEILGATAGDGLAYSNPIVAEHLDRKIVYTVNLTVQTADIAKSKNARNLSISGAVWWRQQNSNL